MKITVGIDEAGRGCWAGPLVAAAVILKPGSIEGMTDSKKLSASRRTAFSEIIRNEAVDIGVGVVSAEEVDNVGLTDAVRLAMNRAVQGITVDYDLIIIDGNYNYLADNGKSMTLVKADSKIPSVSAASIIAKTTRDKMMLDAVKEFPEYGFEKHVGYGTKLHLARLKMHGPCRLHRASYRPIRSLARDYDVQL